MTRFAFATLLVFGLAATADARQGPTPPATLDAAVVRSWKSVHDSERRQVCASSGNVIASCSSVTWISARCWSWIRICSRLRRHSNPSSSRPSRRSDSRPKLRSFFEVDRHYVTVAALTALAEGGEIKAKVVSEAIGKYGLDPEKPNPVTV